MGLDKLGCLAVAISQDGYMPSVARETMSSSPGCGHELPGWKKDAKLDGALDRSHRTLMLTLGTTLAVYMNHVHSCWFNKNVCLIPHNIFLPVL